MKEKKKDGVYIACSMIKSKKIDLSLLNFLINYSENQGYHPFTPGKMDDATPKEIYERDIKMLSQSQIILADVNEPSHGVGMEIMYGIKHDIPVICLIMKNNFPLSRMVEGSPNTLILDYETEKELEEKMEKIRIEEIKIKLCKNCKEKTFHMNNECIKC
ncbi:MAG: hypothetical protein ACFFDS_08985 [Candidatus Thorarchaeota archaeon]